MQLPAISSLPGTLHKYRDKLVSYSFLRPKSHITRVNGLELLEKECTLQVVMWLHLEAERTFEIIKII